MSKPKVIPATAFPPDRAIIGEQDYYLFNEGSHYRLYEKFGAHPCTRREFPAPSLPSGRRR